MLPDNLPLALVCALLLVLPGLALGAAAGARGWLLVGSAPVLTLGFASIAAPALSLLGIQWQPASAAIALLALAVLLAAVLRPWRPWKPWWSADPAHPLDAANPVQTGATWSRVHHAVIGLTVLGAGVLGAVTVARGTADLTGIHQYWDAMFHANAVRFISSTGETDPYLIGQIAHPASPSSFYPDIYHVLTALAYDLGVGDMPTTLDAVAATFPLLFVLSLVAMTRVIFSRPAVVFAVALVGTTFSAFPYDLINFGPLWPFALALAAAPAVVGLVARMLEQPSPTVVTMVALGAAGLLSTHPAVGGSIAIIAIFQVAVFLVQRRFRVPRAWWLSVGGAAVLAVLFSVTLLRGITRAASASGGVDWPAWTSPGGAVGVLLTLNHENASPQWILAGLTLIGLVVALRHRQLWPLVAFAGLMAFFFVISSAYDNSIVQLLTSFWWNDRWRFIALIVLPAALFAGLGLVTLRDFAVTLVSRVPRMHKVRVLRVGVLVLAAAVFIGATGLAYRDDNTARVAIPYQNGPTVSSDELEAYRVLADMYDGGTVMNDPADGSPWLYALEGIPLVFQAPLSAPYTADLIGQGRLDLLSDFDRYGADRAVDDLVADLDIRWVVIGAGFAGYGVERSPGLDHLDGNRELRQVFDNGSAQIYEVLR